MEGRFAVTPFSFRDFSMQTHGTITVSTFTEDATDEGDLPGESTTRWTCAKREGTSTSRCTGVGQFTGTGSGMEGPAQVRLTATCTDNGARPLFVTCEGRFRLDGIGSLEGVHGQGTFQSAGLFVVSVTGTSVMRLHDHR